MALRDASIRGRLMSMMLATGLLVLVVTCTAFLAYEFFTYRQAATRQLEVLGKVIAANSTAALAFYNPEDAQDVLAALRAEPDIVAAVLYDAQGDRFATYPRGLALEGAPARPSDPGFRFTDGLLSGFQPVMQDSTSLGTLYLAAGQGALYARLRLYAIIAVLVMVGAILLAYPLSNRLQQQISRPILALAGVAEAVSQRHDYSVRAPELGGGELGLLTGAFNHMLSETQQGEGRLRNQLARLGLLSRLTRAIGERQDLASVLRVVVGTLESDLPVDFACLCLYDPAHDMLSVSAVGTESQALAPRLGLVEGARLGAAANGLTRSVGGELVYEPDTHATSLPFTQLLSEVGLRSLVAAPLLLEGKVVGLLIAVRREANAFSSGDSEFLGQLSEHVALAAHQTQIHEALQQAYDDLRHSQNTVLQQERLRALGQMASGIAHDINNAISPVALYVENLLEKEQLSPRARDYLKTIERAIEDVAATVARMREFYRQREPQISLAPADLSSLAQQAVELTRARWLDIPQQRGVVIEMRTELAPNLPRVMVAETEVRDALTNLVFNAVDAMPEGGTLTLGTSLVTLEQPGNGSGATHVQVAVGDTGVGMDEETRRRCLEPFFTTKGERGTGLGLAMVYGMIQRHSADLDIQSAPGKGTNVLLRFPVPVGVTVTNGMVDVVRMPGRQRILVVDDDPMLIQSLRDTLEGDGHVVVTAAGGREGVEAFRLAIQDRAAFTVVITDLGMPHVDGRQVAAEVKRMSGTTPVVMLTGWGQRMAAEGDIPPHVDRLLSKPPKLSILRSTLADLCHESVT